MRDDLRFTWPYAASHVNASLDPALIEKHGIDRISRALDIGHVVAFLGSGTSMSYGRASWQGLVDHLRDDVVGKFKRTLAQLYGVSDLEDIPSDIRQNIPPDILTLKKTLDTVEKRGDDALASERYPILFQITEQLNAMLVAEENRSGQTPKEDLFREHTKRLAYDDREHAKHLIRSALNFEYSKSNNDPKPAEKFAAERWRDTGDDCGPQPEFQRDFPTPDRDSKSYYWYLKFFECETALVLGAAVKKGLRNVGDPNSIDHAIGNFVEKLMEVAAGAAEQRSHLLPLHRFIVPCLSLLQSQPSQLIVVPTAFDEVKIPESGKTNETNHIERRALIAFRRDPIALLIQELRIHRFLTTNFDMEIERMFDALGYRIREKATTDDRMNEFESRARDFAFTSREADLLIDFATQDQSVEYQVCHVHGRAIKGEEKSLVVTEQDYNNIYIRGDETRDLVDESIRLAFGASPLLFVGQGMSEEDLLRPLRHFMSDNRLPPERLAVALLPGSKSDEERQRDTISFFVRYRVYAVHSGSAEYEAAERPGDATSANEPDPNWLSTVVTRKKLMIEYIERLRDAYGIPRNDHLSASKSEKERVSAATKAMSAMAELAPSKPPLVSSPAARALSLDGALRTDIAKLDGVAAEGDLQVKAEIEILNAARSILITEHRATHRSALESPTLTSAPITAAGRDTARRLRSLQIAIEGAMDALMSVSVCAKILSIAESRREWRDRWRRSPPERQVEFNLPLDGAATGGPICRVRHRIDPPVRFNPKTSPTGAGPARMFRNFVRALEEVPNVGKERRVFLIVGGHGAGKGHFFTLFQRKELLEEFCAAQGSSFDAYGAFIFANMSYSAEVASVWDGINKYIGEYIEVRRRAEDYLSRLDRLDQVLGGVRVKEKRVLIGLNAVDILFDRDGYPKNAHVRRTFDTLLGDKHRDVPLDLVFITDEERIPIYFRKMEPAPKGNKSEEGDRGMLASINAQERIAVLERVWGRNMQRAELSFALHQHDHDVAKREIAGRVKRFRINVPDEELDATQPVAAAVDASQSSAPADSVRRGAKAAERVPLPTFLYYLRGPHILEHTTNYFPTLLVLLGLGAWPELHRPGRDPLKTARWKDIEACGRAFQKIVQARIIAWRTRGTLALNSRRDDETCERVDRFLDRVHPSHEMIYPILLFRIVLSQAEIWGRAAITDDPADTFETELNARLDAAVAALERNLDSPLGTEAGHQQSKDLDELEAFALRCWTMAESYRRALERNRFCMTIFFRAAEELCRHEGEADTSDANTMDKVFARVHGWVDRTLQSVSRVEEARRDEAILSEVLKLYEFLAAQDGPHGGAKQRRSGVDPPISKLSEYRLQLSILLHIAVIGQPIEADVLACCPEIRRLAKDVCDGKEASIVAGVYEQLRLLLDRHLIFEIGSDPRVGGGGDAERRRRFALHRIVGRHSLRRLEGPLIDFSQVDFFALSLYSVQQRDIARPTAPGYKFLRDLLMALIGFPTANQPTNSSARVFQMDDNALTARRLRAAYGIVRTVFSVVVVSRFLELDFLDQSGADDGGYFEQHRLLVRWMLRLATDLDARLRKLQRTRDEMVRRKQESTLEYDRCYKLFVEAAGDPERKAGHEVDIRRVESAIKKINEDIRAAEDAIAKAGFVPPFFREQILWIHNECAMFSLVQGRMHDATAHFELALNYAANIEGRRSEGGALDARVRLNRAVAEIDRGNGRAHIQELNKIVETTDENPAIRASARGWIGVIERLSGDQSSARVSLEEAIKELELMGQLRGASIFHRNLGILDLNMKFDKAAKRHFRQAQALAEAGGHEDIRQYALLEVIRAEGKLDERLFRPGTLTQLHSIEKYARVMGIPRLESDVYRSRGYLLLHQGETKLAGALAEKALEIATLNGLTLRKIAAMILLGKTYYERDHHRACRTMLGRAIELARRANYQEAVDRAEIALARAAVQ